MQHSRPGIVGRTSADADDESGTSFLQGIAYQFARAVCGGLHRVSLFFGDKGQSADSRHFDKGGCSIGGDAIFGLDKFHAGVVCPDGLDGSLCRVQHDGEHPFASVGNGDEVRSPFGVYLQDAFAGGFSCFGGCQASFEGVDGDDNFHGCFVK